MQPESSSQPSGEPSHPDSPATWLEAISGLVQSRLRLIQLELSELAQQRIKSLVSFAVAAICLFFTWALILAGGIAAIAAATCLPWYWVALIAAGLHLLVALVLFKLPKGSSRPPFPVTRSEFEKDREWIASLQKTPKSRN